MNKLLTLALTLAALLVAVPPGLAGACKVSTSKATYQHDDMYVVVDTCLGCLGSIWIYEESNRIDGLQRSDPTRDDTCRGQIPADGVIL